MSQTPAIPAAVHAVMAGDATRFADVVHAFDGLVRRIVGRSLRDPHAREDVVQDIWLRIYRQVQKLLDVRAAEAWITRVAQNCVLDHLKKKRATVSVDPMADERLLGASRPVDAPQGWVWDLVESLRQDLRQLLIWRYRDALAYDEIARRLDVPLSTVRGRLYTARLQLRQKLASRQPCERRKS